MFGIPDPGIWSVYILTVLCVVFSTLFGIVYWNKDDKNDKND
jgi:hypothetical protein